MMERTFVRRDFLAKAVETSWGLFEKSPHTPKNFCSFFVWCASRSALRMLGDVILGDYGDDGGSSQTGMEQ